MEKALQAMRSNAENKKKYIKFELQFHQAIIRAAHNTILEDFMEKMYKVLFESRKKTVEQLRDVYRESYLDHYQIYRHIRGGNPKRARQAMVKNLSAVEERFRRDSRRGRMGSQEVSR